MTWEVELCLGADLTQAPTSWRSTSISSYVRATDRISISRGRADEFTTSGPAQCRLTLINDGRFVPRNPTGAYYGSIGRNTPLRVTKRPATNSASDAFGRTASSSWGSADVGGAWTNNGGAASDYSVASATGGRNLHTATASSHQSTLASVSLSRVDVTVRVKVNALSTGGSQRAGVIVHYADASNSNRGDLVFDTAGNITAALTSRVAGVESTVTSASTGLTHNTSTSYWMRIQTGLTGTTSVRFKVWAGQLSDQPATWLIEGSAAAFPSVTSGRVGLFSRRETGNTNTNATFDFDDMTMVDGPRLRFFGYVPNWPTVFADHSTSVSYAPVVAYGLRQRLAQTPVLKSAMTRSIPKQSEIVAHWALEDNTGALSAVSTVAGVQPMRSGPSAPKFGSASGPAGAATAADFSQGGVLYGTIPSFSTTSWRVEFGAVVNSLNTGEFNVICDTYSSGGVQLWEIVVPSSADGTCYIQFVFSDGTFTTVDTGKHTDDGQWHLYRIDVQNVGGQAFYAVWIDGLVTSATSLLSASYGMPTSVVPGPTNLAAENPRAMSYVAVWNTSAPLLDTWSAFNGFVGETASARFTRLGAEEGLSFKTLGSSSTLMGPQRQQSLTSIIDEIETTDQGLIFDGVDGYLTFTPHDLRYNRTVDLTLSVASKHLAPGFQATDDDQQMHNDVTATAPTGTSYEYKVTTGSNNVTAVGTYALSFQANVAYDYLLPFAAQWKAYQGTNPDLRYPQLQVNLIGNPSLVEAWLACDVGSRAAVTGMSTLAVLPSPDLDLFIDGYTETGTNEEWLVDLNAVSASRWAAFVLDSSLLDTGVVAL